MHIARRAGSSDKADKMDKWHPRVVLKPLRSDSNGHSRYRFSTVPPSATLFNQPEMSDIKLCVGDHVFYCHKLILSAASDVFARMFNSEWSESTQEELALQEEVECIKVFDRFLKYFYTGNIVISENFVIALFMLADKYNVKALYDECVKVIENGLKVYVVTSSPQKMSTSRGNSPQHPFPLPSSSSEGRVESPGGNLTGDDESAEMEGSQEVPSRPVVPVIHSTMHLVGSETFPLSVVVRLCALCQNETINKAAIYNLEARLGCQIRHGQLAFWNDLEKPLVLQMLADTNFYCAEYLLFQAARSWLKYKPERLVDADEMFSLIRFPTMNPEELYQVEGDETLAGCEQGTSLVREAIRYQLFRNLKVAVPPPQGWNGVEFQARRIKET